ncbi:MAG: DUF47 family protein [Clostridia bacterium]|nr:DUF47 family protein [Clostridia bacterium]
MLRATRKEDIFFDYFVEAVENTCHASALLLDLMTHFTNVEEKIKKIEDAEHEGDKHVHKVLEVLNKSFITPIDREDIYLIAKETDNIFDAIEATAHRFSMLNVTAIRPEGIEMAKLIVDCTNELREVMINLREHKKHKNPKDIVKKMGAKSDVLLKERIIEVNRIENIGDVAFRKAMTNLFKNEKDAVEVVKWKQIFELLENTLDACEDVANIIEGVVMKHA